MHPHRARGPTENDSYAMAFTAAAHITMPSTTIIKMLNEGICVAWAGVHPSASRRPHVTSCTSDVTPAGSDTQPVGEMAHFLQVRNGKTGRQEPPTDRSLPLLQVLMWKRCNNFLCHTATDWRNHFYTQWHFNSGVFFWRCSNIHSLFDIMVCWWGMGLFNEHGELQKWC